MGRWTGVVMFSLSLVLVGCAEAGEDGEAARASGDTAAELAAADDTVDAESDVPACEPSDRMEVAGRTSPYDSTTLTVDGGVAKVCYGRPALRGRTMIGGDAVPWGQLWRTGANEPTTIHVTAPMTIGGLEVEPGAYSLYTIPQEGDEWTLIVNRSTSQWGHESTYTEEVEAQEVGRAPVHAETVDEEIEEFTIRPMDGDAGLTLEWQNSRVHIPIAPAG